MKKTFVNKKKREGISMAVMTKSNNRAFVVDSSKAQEFLNLKPNKENLQRIREKSKKMRECIIKDERHQKR